MCFFLFLTCLKEIKRRLERYLKRLDSGQGKAVGKSEFVGITINRLNSHWVCAVVFNPCMVTSGADGTSRPRPWIVSLDSYGYKSKSPLKAVSSTELDMIEWYLKVTTRT